MSSLAFLSKVFLTELACDLNVIVHGLQKGIKSVELAFESNQPSKGYSNI